jgi:dodecin
MAVIKVIELMGASANSWEQAALQIVEEACLIMHHVHDVQIIGYDVKIEYNRVVEYRITARLLYDNISRHDYK